MLAERDAPVLSEPELASGLSSVNKGVGSVSARARLATIGELGAAATPANDDCSDKSLSENIVFTAADEIFKNKPFCWSSVAYSL